MTETHLSLSSLCLRSCAIKIASVSGFIRESVRHQDEVQVQGWGEAPHQGSHHEYPRGRVCHCQDREDHHQGVAWAEELGLA